MNIERPTSPQPIPGNAKLVFKGQLFDVYQWEQELFDGSKKIFEKIKRPDTVVVFPVLPDGSILLTKQSQPGREAFVDGAGGRMDKNEDPLQAAQRELLEETGYQAKEYVLWKAIHPTAKIEWVVYVFIAKDCTKSEETNLEGGEKVDLMPVTFEEFLGQSKNEQFRAREVVPDLLEAYYDEGKREELKKLFY